MCEIDKALFQGPLLFASSDASLGFSLPYCGRSNTDESEGRRLFADAGSQMTLDTWNAKKLVYSEIE